MTDHDQKSDHRDCGGDAAAYALGALEPSEAAAFRRHLDSCAICRDEVTEFRAVVSTLPLAAPPHPAPRALKRRVMAEVRAGTREEGRATERRWRWLLTLPRPAVGLAATGLAVVLAALVVVIGSGGTSMRLIQATVTARSATAVLEVSGGHGELIVRRLPAPPAGKVYEVWVQHHTQPPSPTNALFSVAANGSASVDVPGSLQGVRQIMVTPEPAGGSKVPTHAPVLVARLA